MRDANTQQELERKQQTLAHIPYLTDRGTFIHNGSEYVMLHQLRLKPGIYTREKENGEIESHVNARNPHESHRYFLDPAKGVFYTKLHQAKIPLITLMKTLGATDSQLREAWGPEIYSANMQADSPAALRKYEERLVRHLPPDAEPATRQMALRAAIEGIGLDPRATQSTLGQPYANLGLAPILATTRKLLAVGRGEAQPDDRDAMAYQRAMGPEDLIAERIAKDYSGTRRNLLMRASFMGGLKAVPPLALNRQVESALLHSGLGQYLEEINAAEVFDKQGRVTRMGEGGLPGADSIPDSARGVHGSQLGVIDPLRTPESSRSGVDLYFSRMARKGTDGQVYAPFEDVRTGKTVYRSPQQIADLTVGFPQRASDVGRSHVAAVRQGQLRYEKQSNLDLRVPNFEDAFSPLANLIPLKSAAQGQRGSMGSRFLRSNSPPSAFSLAGAQA